MVAALPFCTDCGVVGHVRACDVARSGRCAAGVGAGVTAW